mmetsp:Transcript_28967/g.52955  ORF Transcript_28967/g.52955 Transcript_28967/m.52955 type:complete len:517 (-) Transcript_28967:2562-4112(-)
MTSDHHPNCDGSKYPHRSDTSALNCNDRSTPRTPYDPSGHMAKTQRCQESRCSRMHTQKGNMQTYIKKGSSFQDAQKVDELCYDNQDTVSMSATLSTVSCTSADSSFLHNGESKNDRNDQGSIFTASVDGTEHDAETDDGYETKAAFAIASVRSSNENVSRTQHREMQTSDQQVQQMIQQIVEQLLQEQTIAIEAWNEVAEEYHRRIEPFTSSFIPHLLDPNLVSPSHNHKYHYLSGKSILDIGAGTGAGTLYAASRGASSVVATDFSENMLRVLRNRVEALRYNNVETKNANGLCLPLSWTNNFDISYSNFGVIYFPKVKEGLLEMVRCTKQGGKVCYSGWGSKEETQAFSVFPKAIERCGLYRTWYLAQSVARKHLLESAGIPLPSSRKQYRSGRKHRGTTLLAPNYFCPAKRVASSQSYLHSMMVEAGLDNIHVTMVTNILQLDSAESYWDRFVLASPNLKRFIKLCLSPEEVVQLKNAVCEIVQEESSGHCAEDGVMLKASAYIAIGTKILG